MIQAGSLARAGLLDFLCRPPRESEREALLQAAVDACLSISDARRAWAKLGTHALEASGDAGDSRCPYGVEIPIELGSEICGTVGVETAEPGRDAAHARVASVAAVLATWEGRRRLGCADPPQLIVGRSAEILEIERLARRYANLEEPVLIHGETGVGKELIAHLLHCLSDRADRRMNTINCAAVPDELITSELFGHKKGSFTGAVRDQRGRFEVADGGTLFLDEIGEMGPNLQAALLRVLEYGEVQQLGDEGRMRRINVRIVAASNRDLVAAVEAGNFRSDLYYRLSALAIEVPPLRRRPEDISALTEYFVATLEERWGQSLEMVSRAVNNLLEYPFPGNVRELRNLVLRAAATACEGRIESVPLPNLAEPFSSRPASLSLAAIGAASAPARPATAGFARFDDKPGVDRATRRADEARRDGADLTVAASASDGGNGAGRSTSTPMTLDRATAAHLRKVMAMAKGNVSQAARMLDIPRTTLQSKLQRYGVN